MAPDCIQGLRWHGKSWFWPLWTSQIEKPTMPGDRSRCQECTAESRRLVAFWPPTPIVRGCIQARHRCSTAAARLANGSSRPTGQAARQTGQRGQPRPRLLTRLLTWRAGALPCAPTKYTQASAVCLCVRAQEHAHAYAEWLASRHSLVC